MELKQDVKGKPVVSARCNFGDLKVKHLRSGGALEMSFETIVHLRTKLTPQEIDRICINSPERDTFFVYFDEVSETMGVEIDE